MLNISFLCLTLLSVQVSVLDTPRRADEHQPSMAEMAEGHKMMVAHDCCEDEAACDMEACDMDDCHSGIKPLIMNPDRLVSYISQVKWDIHDRLPFPKRPEKIATPPIIKN